MKYNGLTYCSDTEQQDDCIKTYHYAKHSNGMEYPLDISPYIIPNQEEFEQACRNLYKKDFGATLSAPTTYESFFLGFFWAVVSPNTPQEVLDEFSRNIGAEVTKANYTTYVGMVQGQLGVTGNQKYAINHVDKRMQSIENFTFDKPQNGNDFISDKVCD